MSLSLDVTVPHVWQGPRLDAFLTKHFAGELSRSRLHEAIVNGTVLVNGKAAKPSLLLKEGDRVTGSVEPQPGPATGAEAIPLQVVYEDDSLIVVNKAAGMVVHPGAGNRSGTLVNALLGRGGKLSKGSGIERPGIVHRLDKDTSGLIVVAKDDKTHRALQDQFQSRDVAKSYAALVWGKVEFEEGHVTATLGRHKTIRTRMAVSQGHDAREAETRYKVLKRFRRATLLEVRILTGRTHQIRVHMAHLKHPVVGDPVYGRDGDDAPRMALHAWKLEFTHPKTGKLKRFEAPWPADFQALVDRSEKESQ